MQLASVCRNCSKCVEFVKQLLTVCIGNVSKLQLNDVDTVRKPECVVSRTKYQRVSLNMTSVLVVYLSVVIGCLPRLVVVTFTLSGSDNY